MSPGAGRIGLALSGGGFRAALFHVGVLKHLAELNLLRNVRMVSCVSGGSIAGAVYYLTLVRRLMETNEIRPGEVPPLRDELLTTDEYALCAEQTGDIVLAAAQSNIRAMVFRNPWKNLIMFLSPRYSRTDRAGDMLDKRLREGLGVRTGFRYRWVANQLELRTVHAKRPDLPRLALNATTLNTGHVWRFETDRMGEPMPDIRRFVDKNARLSWGEYASLPEEHANFPVSLAVAASAAFPGLFRPLPIGGLYGRRVDLMDGGAQDNQGIQTLMDFALADPAQPLFDRIIVSDGSGRLADEGTKRRGLVNTGRIIAIQGDRIREEQLLAARHIFEEGGGRFNLVDLRHGLPYTNVSPEGDVTSEDGESSLVRERLGQLRTDLDAFGPLETTLLERRGHEVAATVLGNAATAAPALTEIAPSTREDRVLSAARSQLWKPLLRFMVPVLVPWIVVALAVVAGALVALRLLGEDLGWRQAIMAAALPCFFLAPAAVSRMLLYLARRSSPSRRVKRAAGASVYGALLALAVWLGPSLADLSELSWTRCQTAAVAVGLLIAPAVLPFVVALLMLAEGLWWKRLARQ